MARSAETQWAVYVYHVPSKKVQPVMLHKDAPAGLNAVHGPDGLACITPTEMDGLHAQELRRHLMAEGHQAHTTFATVPPGQHLFSNN